MPDRVLPNPGDLGDDDDDKDTRPTDPDSDTEGLSFLKLHFCDKRCEGIFRYQFQLCSEKCN